MITLPPQSVVPNQLVTIPLPDRRQTGSLVIANESNLTIQLQISPSSPFNIWLPAWVVDRIDIANYLGYNGAITILPQNIQSGSIPVPSSSLLITVYFVGEPISSVYPYSLTRVTQ